MKFLIIIFLLTCGVFCAAADYSRTGKTDCSPSDFAMKKNHTDSSDIWKPSSNTSKKDLRALLLARFNEQTGLNHLSKIPWFRYHVQGWPRGVTLNFAFMREKDVLAIYRHLNEITWTPVQSGEERTITYADGSFETLTCTVASMCYKINWHQDRDDNLQEAEEEDYKRDELNEAVTQPTIVTTDDDIFELVSLNHHLPTSPYDQQVTVTDNHNALTLKAQRESVLKRFKQKEDHTPPSEFPTTTTTRMTLRPKRKSVFTFEDDTSDTNETCDTNDTSDTKTQKSQASEFVLNIDDAVNHRIKCQEMDTLIKSIASKQLKSPLNDHLSYYEIQNWPQFCSLNFKHWDQQALDDIKAALPTLIFKESDRINARKDSFRAVKENRTKMSVVLLNHFRAQVENQDIPHIPWSQCHVLGWPPGVSIYCSYWKATDMQAIYRNLRLISWQKVQAGEIWTVFYSDGSSEPINRISSNRSKKPKRLEMFEDDSDIDVVASTNQSESTDTSCTFDLDNIDDNFSLFDD